MIRILTSSLAMGALAACSSTPAAATAKAIAATEAAASAPAEGLPPQRLAPGECGLFLWGMAAPRKFVFFAKATSGNALVLMNESPTSLSMAAAGGDVFGQFLTEMEYAGTEPARRVKISVKPGEVLEGGQRVESGTILFIGADGWETVLPVTGVRACMPGG
ncbi:hypothetical protein [Hyphomonas sp.]|uniref:hypothetical protein n=1 Tax=Hyphomonas sp. TaxID=87 RepID=UPI00391BFF05